jgi:ABC-type transport system involved in multi-copper enzyme maturation permease subunit
MQNTILDERKTGTGGWILSKPVSRTAFILSKLAANSIALLLLMVVVPGAVAFTQFSLKGGTMLPILPFVGGLAIMALHLLFYISLTLMLGTLVQGRGAVIGIPLLLILGYQLFMMLLPQLGYIMPWGLVIPLTEGSELGSLAGQTITGQPLSSPFTLVAVAIWVILFVAVALWRFQREEF